VHTECSYSGDKMCITWTVRRDSHKNHLLYQEIGMVLLLVSLIAGLICIERWSYGKYPMPISRYGEGYV